MTLKTLYYYSDYVSKIVLLLYGAYVYAYIYLVFRVLYIEYSLYGEHTQGIKETKMTIDVTIIIPLFKEHLCGGEFYKKHFSGTNLFNPNRRFAGRYFDYIGRNWGREKEK